MQVTEWYPLPLTFELTSLSSLADKARLSLRHVSDNTQTLSLYDTFDWRLIQSDRLLLFANGTMRLIDSSRLTDLTNDQCDQPKGDFQPASINRELGESITGKVAPRILFERYSHRLQESNFDIRDDEEKRIGRLVIYSLITIAKDDNEKELLTRKWLVTLPLKGYKETLTTFIRSLTGGATAVHSKPLEQQLTEIARKACSEGYISKPQMQFTPDTESFELLRDSLQLNLNIALTNIDGIGRDRDPEFLHDFRVSLRRMRAQLSLLKGVYCKPVDREMKALLGTWARSTNALRDLDVWLLETSSYHSALPASLHEGLAELTATLQKQRRVELKKVRAYLQSTEFEQQKYRLANLIEDSDSHNPGKQAKTPAHRLAAKAFSKHCSHIIKLCVGTHSQSADEDIHKIRIECKKLRYLTELFKPIAQCKTWTAVTSTLKNLQDELGRFNDLSVQQRFLETRINPLIEKQLVSSGGVMATGALLALLSSEQLQEKQRILSNLSALAEQLQQPATRNLFGVFNQESQDGEKPH